MRGMVRLLRHDMRHLRSSVIAVVVFAGIVAVPSFYAWFNIAGSWDPYGRTGDVRVAVANEDAGYEGALVPVRVNLGERVVAELCSSTSIGYEVTSADEAVEGVRSGRYYAAVVVPKDFSRDLMTVFSADPVRAEVPFYQNEKENAIASIVTGKAADSVQSDIGRSFAEAVADVGTAALQELSGLLDDDAVVALAGRLDDAVTLATDELETTAGDVRELSSLLSSTQALLGSGAGTVDAALSPALDVSGALGDAASGLDDAGAALDSAQSSVRDALAQAGTGVDGVGTAIDDAFDAAGAQVARVRGGLVSAHDAVAAQVTLLERLYGALDEQDGLTREFQGHLEAGSATVERVETVRVSVEGLRDRVGQALDDLRALEDGISDAIADLDTGTADAQEARERLAGLVEDARDAVAGAGTAFDDTAKESLDELAGLVEDAASQAGGMRDALSETLASVSSSANGAAQTLSSGAEGLTKMADDLDAAAGRLSDLHDKLRSALDSHDAQQVRAVLSAGPTELARFVAEPVSVERTAVFPVENNGSAMAPFYTTLAIWIGGVVLAALVRTAPSEAALEETGCSAGQAYLGRLALFCAVGVAQAALIWGGDLLYLGVQCEHPWLMLLACVTSSIVYVNVIFSLAASFGDVGKAVAVVLMVIQVAGSGGTFPPEMLPAAFQELYRWLPFVHSEAALRAAMFGIWDGDFWRELGVLLAYLAPALFLGLVVRRPLIRLGAWFEHRLEDTRLM